MRKLAFDKLTDQELLYWYENKPRDLSHLAISCEIYKRAQVKGETHGEWVARMLSEAQKHASKAIS